jgi:DNA-binding HxlR family transcriptional regulator
MPACPVQTAVSVMGGKWKPGLLYRLRQGPYRLSELRRHMPWISEKVLIRQLRELEADGIVLRHDHHEKPPRVDYSLTEYGQTLGPLLDEMCRWGGGHLDRSSPSA